MPRPPLPPDVVESIREMRKEGLPNKVIAARCGVSTKQVWYYTKNERWFDQLECLSPDDLKVMSGWHVLYFQVWRQAKIDAANGYSAEGDINVGINDDIPDAQAYLDVISSTLDGYEASLRGAGWPHRMRSPFLK